MEKNKLVLWVAIPVSVLLLALLAVWGFARMQQNQVQYCGDGVCSKSEKIDPNACQLDCILNLNDCQKLDAEKKYICMSYVAKNINDCQTIDNPTYKTYCTLRLATTTEDCDIFSNQEQKNQCLGNLIRDIVVAPTSLEECKKMTTEGNEMCYYLFAGTEEDCHKIENKEFQSECIRNLAQTSALNNAKTTEDCLKIVEDTDTSSSERERCVTKIAEAEKSIDACKALLGIQLKGFQWGNHAYASFYESCVISVASSTNKPEYCEGLGREKIITTSQISFPYSPRNTCYKSIAEANKDPEICRKIDSSAGRGVEDGNPQLWCYTNIAWKTKNTSICKKYIPKNDSYMVDGIANYYRKDCMNLAMYGSTKGIDAWSRSGGIDPRIMDLPQQYKSNPCGDGTCDDIEKSTGMCPQDCK